MNEVSRSGRKRDWSGYLLGFALGGFFDGILLHQILQWHHLLSGLEEARHDIRFLILTDGLFHLLMYVVAIVGLWFLWQQRRAAGSTVGDHLLPNALVGFGTWHIVDAVLSHWLLGIHRIRMDVDNPLLWDLLWLGIFGVLPLAFAFAFRRRAAPGPRLLSSPLVMTAAVLIAAATASLPSNADRPVMVLFRSDVGVEAAMAAIQATGGRLLWTDPSQQLWAVQLVDGSDPNRFYSYGALMVSNSILPAGCLDFLVTDAKL